MTPVEELTLAAERLEAIDAPATPGPWFYNSYSALFSGPQQVVEDAFWTEERHNDGHTYDHHVGAICPACGERPAVYSESAKPEVRGQRFGTYWDCALHHDAYEADACVATVPAEYGDTATGRHKHDAAFIAAMRGVAKPLAVVLRLSASYWKTLNWSMGRTVCDAILTLAREVIRATGGVDQ